jgi:hypothetical protein
MVKKIKYHVPIIQWADYQQRLFKNNGNIKYKNKVHEILDGYTIVASLPEETEWSLLHRKTMDKQLKQNSLYNKLQS